MKKLLDRHPILFVTILLLVTLSPLMALRDCTPSNELRYLSIVDEALSDGHVFAFTNQGENYADKPPMYFWLMMLCKMLFGTHCMFALSMLSFIPACVIFAVMDKWLRRSWPGCFSSRQRAATALMLATSGLFLGMAVVLRMDMLMCMWTVLALWTFWKSYDSEEHKGARRFLLPFYTFMALFTKGPVGILVPPLAIIVFLLYEHKGKEIKKYLGFTYWAVIAAFCAVWFTGVWFDGGEEYLNNLLFHQTVGRAVNSFHHKEPFWYYLYMIWGVMAPWCLAAIPVIILALLKKKGSENATAPSPAEKMFALTSITTFVMLSVFSSKLSIYLAPLFPFVVYLFPVVTRRRGWMRWYTFALAFPCFILGMAGLVVTAASVLCLLFPNVPEIIDYPFMSSPLVTVAGLLLIFGGVKGLMQISRHEGEWERPVLTLSTALLLAVFAVSFKMPAVNDYIGYGNLCKKIPESGEVYTMYIKRPENMDVYLGRDIYDFGKDIDSFLLIAPKTGTLAMSISALGESKALMDYLEGQEVKYCGKYAIYTLDKVSGKSGQKKSRKK